MVQDRENEPEYSRGGKQCGAKSKQSGNRCRRPAVPGKNVCHIHGARAGRPPSTYRYAKVVDKCPELKENYDDLMDEIEESGVVDLSTKEEITLLRARLATALERGGPDGKEPVDLKIIQDMFRDLFRALQKEREIEISRENLVPMAKVREMLKLAVNTLTRFVPAASQEECWEELTRVLQPFKESMEPAALPESTEVE